MVRKSVELRGGHRLLDPFNPYVRSCLYSLVGGLDGELVVVDERVP